MSNIDQAELEKFDSIAENWWDPEGEFKPLHAINPLRLDFIHSHVEQLSDQSILDVGCGGGILSESLAKQGASVTAIDMAEGVLNIAKQHALEQQLEIDYQLSTAEDFATKHAAAFDVVTCMEMLEHVPDPASVVQACAKLVKPGGLVFLSTLNRNLKSFLMAIVGAEYALQLVPAGTHEYGKFIKPSELDRALRANHLRSLDITGIRYHPLQQSYSLDRTDIDVNYLLCAHKDAE